MECRYIAAIDHTNRLITDEVEKRLGRIFDQTPPTANTSFLLFIEDEILGRVLEEVCICEVSNRGDVYYHYKLVDCEDLHTSGKEQDQENESEEPRFNSQTLPNSSLKDSWDSLYFEGKLKEEVLSYVSTMLMAATCAVNLRIFDLHKIILLHGPPGCGKTSLCKALAQKIGVRASRLTNSPCSLKLIEVNCHSLFSKWFSESGKQIKEMFDDVRKLAIVPGAFVCILIDEIESISISRTSLFKGSEPSDSIRAVNVLLTQIDQIRELSNVLILATSNLPETVDAAFMDRVDRKFQLGPPSLRAKREILIAGIRELVMRGMVEDFDFNGIDNVIGTASGRLVRKLPFLALAGCLNRTSFPLPSAVFLDELTHLASRAQENVYE